MKKDLIFYFLSNILSKLIVGISFILLARLFTKLEFGLLKTSLSISGLIFIFINFGLSDYFLFKFSKNKSSKIIKKIYKHFYLNYIIALFFYSISFLFLEIKLFILTFIFLLKAFPDWLLDIAIKYFQGLNNFNKVSLIVIIQSLPLLIATLFVFFYKNIYAYALILLLFSFSFIIIIYYLCKLKFSLSLSFNIRNHIKILKISQPFFISNFMAYIYMQSDVLMLYFFKNYEEVARYSVSVTIIMASYLIPTILYNYYLPKLIEGFKQIFIFKKFFHSYLYLNLTLSFLLFIFLFLFSKKLILFLYTEKYIDSILIFKILLFVFLFHSIIFPYASVLTASGNQKLRSKIQILAAIINIILNLVFIPIWAAEGASFATAITEVIIFLIYFITSIRLIKK